MTPEPFCLECGVPLSREEATLGYPTCAACFFEPISRADQRQIDMAGDAGQGVSDVWPLMIGVALVIVLCWVMGALR